MAELDGQQWNSWLSTCPHAHVLQTREWASLKALLVGVQHG